MGDGDDSGGDDEDEVSGVPCIAILSKAFLCTQLTPYEMDGLSSHPKLKSPNSYPSFSQTLCCLPGELFRRWEEEEWTEKFEYK